MAGKAEISSHGTAGAAGARLSKINTFNIKPNPFFLGGGDFFSSFCSYNIQHCFICRPSDSTVPTDAGIEPRTVATVLPTEPRT